MAGLKSTDGFDAGWWLSVGSDLYSWPKLSAYAAALPPAGGGASQFLGTTPCGGDGTLSGGTNPFGIQVAVIDSNTAGVTAGCDAASGAGVGTGIEWAIPLAAIGSPTGCIRICAIDACGDHSCILNQTLGPMPPGTCGTMRTASPLRARSSSPFATPRRQPPGQLGPAQAAVPLTRRTGLWIRSRGHRPR